MAGVMNLEIDLRILREHWDQVRGIRNPPIAPGASITAVLYGGHPYVAGDADYLVGDVVGQCRLLGRVQRDAVGIAVSAGINYTVQQWRHFSVRLLRLNGWKQQLYAQDSFGPVHLEQVG